MKALCEDCICYESCEDWAEYYEDKEFPYDYCRHFKPKSQYIKLPMQAADWLLAELTEHCHKRCIEEL